MSNFGDAVNGLQTVLTTNIPGLHVANHPVDALHEFPAAVILPESLDPRIGFGGNTFEAKLRVVFLLARGDAEDAFTSLYDHIDPTATNKSVIGAVRTDPTLNGKVDWAQVTAIENIGRLTLWGGEYVGFHVVIEFGKSVA